MLKFTRDSFVDVDTYNEHLHYNGYILYDRKKMEDIFYYESAKKITYQNLAVDVMSHHSNGFYSTVAKEPLYRYLTYCEHCPEHYFKKKGVKGISIDMKKVIDKLLSNGYAEEFLENYKRYRNCESYCNTIRKVLEECTEQRGVNQFGIKTHAIYYDVNVQQNLRFNYKNRDIVAFPKTYTNTFTTEDGYFLVWGDFAQSDFRIAFNLLLRNENNTKFMSDIEDKYEGLARLIAQHEGTTFDLAKFREMRKMYKTLTLATMYGTRDSIEKPKQEFIKMLSNYLENCTKYVEYEKRINERIALGMPFAVKSYFGHEEIINVDSYDRNPLFKALNTPIQAGTSEVVILTVNKILDMFYELGYTEDDVSVYMVRHDEPVFKVKETAKKDLWVFKQATDIIVDNWVPLRIDFSPGYYYREVDEDLQKEMQQSYEENADKIEYFESDEENNGEEYYPISPILNMSIYYEKLEDCTLLCFCDIDKNRIDAKIIKTLDDDVIKQYVYSKLPVIEEKAFSQGYFAVTIYNNYYDDKLYLNDRTLFKLIKASGEGPAKAQKITQCIAYKRALKLGIEDKYRQPIQTDLDFLRTVGDLNYLRS